MILHLNYFSKGYSLLSRMQFHCFSVVLVQFANTVLVKTVWTENRYERERFSLQYLCWCSMECLHTEIKSIVNHFKDVYNAKSSTGCDCKS